MSVSGARRDGGHFAAFPNGPVARSAETRFHEWQDRFNETEQPPAGFTAADTERGLAIRGAGPIDPDEFSDAELAATDRAWDAVVRTLDLGWDRSQRFCRSGPFVGRACKSAKLLGGPLDWSVILAQYDQEHGTDVQATVAPSMAL